MMIPWLRPGFPLEALPDGAIVTGFGGEVKKLEIVFLIMDVLFIGRVTIIIMVIKTIISSRIITFIKFPSHRRCKGVLQPDQP